MATSMTIAELEASEPRDLGEGDWLLIGQETIDRFAEVTGDRQWIHVDPERAAAGPFGRTVAHGYSTLSVLPTLLASVLQVTDMRARINYGIDKLRFTAPVPSDSEVRARARLLTSERRGDGVLYKLGVEVEVRGGSKPALVGEVLFLVS
jgi:acyl dehydratase